jgi:hypothetical protein
MALLAMTSALVGAVLSRWFRVLILVPLALGMIVICTGAALAGVLTVTTATLCGLIEMVAMQTGFVAGLIVQSRARARRKKAIAAI